MSLTPAMSLSLGGAASPMARCLLQASVKIAAASTYRAYTTGVRPTLAARTLRPRFIQSSRRSFHKGLPSAAPRTSQEWTPWLKALKEHDQSQAIEEERLNRRNTFKALDSESSSPMASVSEALEELTRTRSLQEPPFTLSAIDVSNAIAAKDAKKEIRKLLPGSISNDIAALLVPTLKDESIYLNELQAKIETIRAEEREAEEASTRAEAAESKDQEANFGICIFLLIVAAFFLAMSLIDDPIIIERKSTKEKRSNEETARRRKEEEEERPGLFAKCIPHCPFPTPLFIPSSTSHLEQQSSKMRSLLSAMLSLAPVSSVAPSNAPQCSPNSTDPEWFVSNIRYIVPPSLKLPCFSSNQSRPISFILSNNVESSSHYLCAAAISSPNIWHACLGQQSADSSDGASFKWNEASQKLEINQTYTCSEGPGPTLYEKPGKLAMMIAYMNRTRYTAYGSKVAGVDCTPTSSMAKIGGSQSRVCRLGKLGVVASELTIVV
ncbi:hypothetical protein BDV96DRAFT_593278 [Lophiotrema nucula]|uniref:Uncharacterized protein n=1 Tax=Lophiotrema nucula TaxID=690887 RepID=A0A6A5ZSY6_9PLEO|nr:hypothetical protein BDV96DRAFT_593278 [Lophiotrema nucula]